MAEFNVGFIGLGIMGESMCANIIKNGYPTWVYDIAPEQVQKMVDLGANACESLEEITLNVSHIIIMVPANEHVIRVIDGLLPTLHEGTIVIDMSTISPTVSRQLAQKVKAAGSCMMDAPVVKSKDAAIKGELGILIGGDAEILEQIRPLLLCMGQKIVHLGQNG